MLLKQASLFQQRRENGRRQYLKKLNGLCVGSVVDVVDVDLGRGVNGFGVGLVASGTSTGKGGVLIFLPGLGEISQAKIERESEKKRAKKESEKNSVSWATHSIHDHP